MAEYWLDSSVFIEGKKGPYGFDIAPGFWAMLDALMEVGRISCPAKVHEELRDGQDELLTWAQASKAKGLFVESDAVAVQEAFTSIVEYVAQNYRDNQSRRRFLDRADPWVIAHAEVTGGTVVSLEQEVGPASSVARIPNVWDHFNVRCITTYQMLRELGVSWTA